MRKILLALGSVLVLAGSTYAQGDKSATAAIKQGPAQPTSGSTPGKWAWTVQPFDHQVFIENRGQFDKLVNNKSKVLFGAQLGDDLFAYFTTNGIVYRLEVYPKLQEALKKESEKPGYDPDKGDIHPVITYFSSEWKGSNPDLSVDAKEEQTYYYTYPLGKGGIKVNIFKKIIYRDLYPGIDAEFTFIPGKKGFEYALIVHPGADLSKVEVLYAGAKSIVAGAGGDVIIESPVGEIIDHAPVSHYQNGGDVASHNTLNGAVESFATNTPYDKSKTLVVDPWIWTSSPSLNTNKAYDIDYDNAGNVYVYGSSGTWQLAKFNNAGVQQWVYNASLISTGYYGDFACDKLSGKCFLTEGFNSSGMNAIEVGTNGIQLNTAKAIDNLQEGWRDAWDPCDDEIVIGGGGWQTICDAGGMLDTNMVITPVNNLNENAAEEGHDMALTCIDANGKQCYMVTTQSAGDPSNFNNMVCQFPVPSLTPAVYMSPTGYDFLESNVAFYVGSSIANGLNGISVSPNWLYIYDGSTLKRLNKTNGNIVSTVNVSGTPQQWSGLAVDVCDNIYVGDNSNILVYNSSLSQVNSYSTNGTTYDLALGLADQALYACGNGFVSYMPLPKNGDTVSMLFTNTSCSGCIGKASAQLYACGSPVVGAAYAWSNGATTSSITGLCAGKYKVTITPPGWCAAVQGYSDSVTITSPGGGFSVTSTQTNIKCYGQTTGSGNVSLSGGTQPYTYEWSPNVGNGPTATGLSAGTYTCVEKDAKGCTDSTVFTITQPTALAATIKVGNIKCNGGTGNLTVNASGGVSVYTYSWSPGGGTNSVLSNLSIGSYTITVTDSNGCVVTASASLTQPTALKDTVIVTGATCGGSDGSAQASASGGAGGYTYSWSPSGGTNAAASGLSAGTYTVTLKDVNGCTKTSSVFISNVGAPSATSTQVNIDCAGNDDGIATVNVTGGTSPYTYNWSPSGGNNATAGNLSAGMYICSVTDGKGCITRDTVIITEPPALADTFSDVQSTCADTNGSAKVTASGGTSPYTYSWSDGKTTASVNPLSAGTYTVTITDSHGCSFTSVTTVNNVGAVPVVQLCCDTTIAPGDTALLTTTPAGPFTYTWFPPNGLSCDTCPNPIATPTVTTTYTLSITDPYGCSTERIVTVKIEIPCSDFKVPNVFTPNDDGINDDFVIRVENPSSYNILIYDRWGKEVYTSNDATKFWNGRYESTKEIVPDGVYYYIIKATCGDNNYVKKGFVHVIGSAR